MATFEKRTGTTGKTTWRVRVRRQSGPRLTKSFPKKSDAQEWARDIEHKLDTGDHVPNSEARKRTLADVIDRYLKDVLPRARRRKNAVKQTALLKWWRAELGSRPLVSVTGAVSADAQAFMQSRVDDYYDMFVRAVAKGRKVGIDAVRKGMGQGRVLGADQAFAEKMVDGVMAFPALISRMLRTPAASKPPSRLAAALREIAIAS